MAEERDEADLDDDTDVSCFFSCCMIQKHVENLRSDEERHRDRESVSEISKADGTLDKID